MATAERQMNRYFAGTLHRSKTSDAAWLMQFEKNEQIGCAPAGWGGGGRLVARCLMDHDEGLAWSVAGQMGLPSFRVLPIEASLSYRLRRLGGEFWYWGIEPAQPQLLGQVLQART